MPARCTGRCLWETVGDDDVAGHSAPFSAGVEIGHVDDPKGGHLVRIRFGDPEDERAFMAILERDRLASAAEGAPG
jgi:hypothetical protein